MSSDNPKDKFPVRKRTRSSGKRTSLGTQSPSASTTEIIGSQMGSAAQTTTPPVPKTGEPENEGKGTTTTLEAMSFDEKGEQSAQGNEFQSTSGADMEIPVDKNTTENKESHETQVPKKPTLEASWKAIEREMRSLEEGWTGGWKDDIDTLLVFAGLFSAVVTGFLVESYQWLEEAPEDTTVVLLRQISQQMNSRVVPPPLPPFKPSPSAVRINVLWFLSLTIGLVVALVGLLCKQWTQELRRPTHTRSPNADVALILLRTWSIDKWHVETIVISLPMLLELALFLFFAGLLDLLHTRHPAPFVAVMVVVIFTGLFYLATTLIPTVDFIGKAFRQVAPNLDDDRRFPVVDNIMTPPITEDTCPYKSPQAWAVFKSFRWMASHIPGIMHALYSLCVICYPPKHGKGPWHGPKEFEWRESFSYMIWYIDEWPDLLGILQRSDTGISPSLQELAALRWIVYIYHDSPAMVPYLRTILESIPLNLVMPAIFGQWFYLPDRQWGICDIDAALRMVGTSLTIDNHLSYPKTHFLNGRYGNRSSSSSYSQFLHWTHTCMDVGDLVQGTVRVPDPPLGAHLPFSRIDNLLKDPNDSQEGPRAIGSRLWSIFTQIARNASETCWGALMQDLAQYIVTSSPDYTFHEVTATTTSPFVESKEGLEFLNQMHSVALDRDIELLRTRNGIIQWVEAMNVVRAVHQLPVDHFPPIPGLFPLSARLLQKTLTSLSSADSGLDFEYLKSYIHHWDSTRVIFREGLVIFLSQHINNYSESGTQPPMFADAGPSAISPLVASSTGLELIAFVNTRLAEERETYDQLGDHDRTAWREALERVRAARPQLPPDFFTPISHEGIDIPPSTPQPPQGKVETQDDIAISTGPEDHAGESKGGNEMIGGPTASGSTMESRYDNEVLLNDGGPAGGGISTLTLTVRDTAGVLTDGGEARLGGPDADKKV
ncbi:hypothetical protein PM082_003494 [Marasmius tenuissimus]|nr:hypothetical protein PM082_003494 [Marasmius tenuissimus]